MIARNHTGHRVGECHGRATVPDATVRQVRADHDAGMGYKRLALKYRVPISTVRDWCVYATRWAC